MGKSIKADRIDADSRTAVRISIPIDYRYLPAAKPYEVVSKVFLSAYDEQTGKPTLIYRDENLRQLEVEPIYLDRADRIPEFYTKGHARFRLSDRNGEVVWEWNSRDYSRHFEDRK